MYVMLQTLYKAHHVEALRRASFSWFVPLNFTVHTGWLQDTYLSLSVVQIGHTPCSLPK